MQQLPRQERDLVLGGLAAVWDTQGRKFVTFERRDRSGAAAPPWVQYLDGELNLEWTTREDPAAHLLRRGVALPRGAFVSWFAAGSNAVIGVGDSRIEEVADFIGALLAALSADPSLELVSRVDSHG